ncbi:terpene synthase family protein [Streptomyces litchfieldiae]|uniref:Terpene synthase n=1 Tax=Streptomyces litchfieldiae TaxID=3075543 RepID=A0ABU2MSI4_9ACTN|nr:terpene cyclase [Streptomyces sp. DSM 44938]MDT0344602.1 terpene cyclase [Streptomyces sp. DSM 44938]
MPQDVRFALPFAARRGAGCDRARKRHIAWMRAHGLVNEPGVLRRYLDWRLTDLAASAYPEATGDDLHLVTDAVCLGFPLDDQFDGPLDRQPERAARLATELAAIPYRAPGAPPRLDLPLTRAYADLWRRSAAGMSPSWRQRAAGHLTRFFLAYLQEAQNRHLGTRLAEDAYVALRRQAVGTAPCFDLIERAGHFEIPPGAYWSRELQTLTRCAGDVIFLCNDVHSVEREEAQDDPHNLLLIRQRARSCSRAEATAQVVGLVAARVALFQTVAARLPALCVHWRLNARGAAAVERYADGLRAWMAANEWWGTASARYTPDGTPGPAVPRPVRLTGRAASPAPPASPAPVR